MSLDFQPECDALLAAIADLCGGRVLDGIPDDAELERRGWDAQTAPYVTVSFGQPRVVLRDRSLLLDDAQPHAMNATLRAWGASAAICRPIISVVMQRVVGLVLSENATQVSVFGGGDFRQKDSSGRPSKYAQQVQIEWLYNMQTPSEP